jgi:hypothetical protein
LTFIFSLFTLPCKGKAVVVELHDALSQIADIRSQMARTRVFRGYRSSTTLFSALVAVVTAVIQSTFLPDPSHRVVAYLALWFSAAALCIVIVGTRIAVRYWRSDSSLERELTLWAVQQFVPCLVVGVLLTYVVMQVAWNSLWMMPGLWTVLFGMGVLASRQVLPRGMAWVGAFYLLCGLVSIECSRTVSAFSPWAMAVPFGIGQAAAAAVLYWRLERTDAAE